MNRSAVVSHTFAICAAALVTFVPAVTSHAQTTTHHVHRTKQETSSKSRRPADRNPLRRVGGYVQTGSRKTGEGLNKAGRTTGNNVKQGSRAVGGAASRLGRSINKAFGGKKKS